MRIAELPIGNRLSLAFLSPLLLAAPESCPAQATAKNVDPVVILANGGTKCLRVSSRWLGDSLEIAITNTCKVAQLVIEQVDEIGGDNPIKTYATGPWVWGGTWVYWPYSAPPEGLGFVPKSNDGTKVLGAGASKEARVVSPRPRINVWLASCNAYSVVKGLAYKNNIFQAANLLADDERVACRPNPHSDTRLPTPDEIAQTQQATEPASTPSVAPTQLQQGAVPPQNAVAPQTAARTPSDATIVGPQQQQSPAPRARRRNLPTFSSVCIRNKEKYSSEVKKHRSAPYGYELFWIRAQKDAASILQPCIADDENARSEFEDIERQWQKSDAYCRTGGRPAYQCTEYGPDQVSGDGYHVPTINRRWYEVHSAEITKIRNDPNYSDDLGDLRRRR